MNAGRRAERIASDERVVDRDVPSDGLRDRLTVVEQLRQVLALELTEQLQVEEQELHLRVADALADAEPRGVDAIGAVLERPDRILEREPAIVVAVPVDADLGAGAGDDVARELDQVSHAVRRSVADGIGEADATRSVIDRGAEQRREDLGTRARRVLRDVGDGQALLHRDVDRLRAPLGDQVHVPVLDVLSDRRRADERVDLDRHTGALRDLDHRCDVRDHGAARTRDLDLHLAVDGFLADAEDVFECAFARARESDVGHMDSEVLHQMEDLELLLDPRIHDGGVLETIAQRLVEERRVLRQDLALPINLVPVEDEAPRSIAFRCEVGHELEYATKSAHGTSGGFRGESRMELAGLDAARLSVVQHGTRASFRRRVMDAMRQLVPASGAFLCFGTEDARAYADSSRFVDGAPQSLRLDGSG